MSDDMIRVTAYGEAHDGKTIVRGLPRVVLQRIGEPCRWVADPVHGWWFESDEMPDLEAKLSIEGIGVSEGGDLAPWKTKVMPMTVAEAEEATTALIACYGQVESAVIRGTYIANEVLNRKGWKVLGFASFEAYCADRLPFTLPKQIRKEVVAAAISEGMSLRAAAAVARTTHTTARRDLATGTNVPVAAETAATRTGMDGREYTHTPARNNVVQMRRVEEPPEPPPYHDARVETVLTAFAEDSITAPPARIHLLRGACDRWLQDNSGEEDMSVTARNQPTT